MNENIDLTKILKNCPVGWKFWSPLLGNVEFHYICQNGVRVRAAEGKSWKLNQDGTAKIGANTTSPEIMLYPSKEMRDWSKFTAPWYKKERFDPKTLKPFDKVLCWNGNDCIWECDFFSYYKKDRLHPCVCVNGSYISIIPYNDETQKFAGTSKAVPEFYCYWED